MIEDERSKEVYPQTINVRILEYIDRTIKTIEAKIESKCDIWRLELSGLRNEWKLEHLNLIQRFESFLKQYEADKIQVQEHFDRQNNFQVRLDKITETHLTAKDVDGRIELALARQTKYTVLVIGLLIAAIGIIAALLGKL
jgi:hypothetical protein